MESYESALEAIFAPDTFGYSYPQATHSNAHLLYHTAPVIPQMPASTFPAIFPGPLDIPNPIPHKPQVSSSSAHVSTPLTVADMRFKCSVCWDDDLELNHICTCPSKHIICVDCVKRGTESAISENTIFVCPAKDSCGAVCGKSFQDSAMTRALPEKLKESHDMVESQLVFAKTYESFAEDDIIVKCPLCADILLLPKETAECVGYHDATKIKCRNCKEHYCKQCNKEWHEGPCDPIARADDEHVQELAIVCLCGSRFIRGDGCNRLKCNRCSRSWCWICKHYFKPNEHGYAEHFWQPSDRSPDTDKCPLYGERPKNQVFAKPPEPPRKMGRGIAVVPEVQDANLAEIPVPVQQVQRLPPITRVNTGRVAKSEPTICGFMTNKNTPCQRRGKKNGICGIHARIASQRG